MELTELKQEIQNKKLNNLYIFYGEEYVVRNRYVDMICDISNLKKKYVDSLIDISNSLNSRSIFGYNIFIINNDSDIIKNEKSWNLLKNHNTNNILILIYNSIDERTSFFKTFKNNIVKFERLGESVLHKYIKKEVKELSDDRINKLLNRCEQDYGKALKVCEKVNILSKVEDRSLNYVYDVLVSDNQIPISVKSMEFELIDALLYKDFSYSLFLYNIIKQTTSSISLLSLIYKNFRNLLIVQSCSSDKIDVIIKKTGIDKWSITNALKYKNVYSISEILYVIKCIRLYDIGLKSGVYEENDIIEGLIVDIFCGGSNE